MADCKSVRCCYTTFITGLKVHNKTARIHASVSQKYHYILGLQNFRVIFLQYYDIMDFFDFKIQYFMLTVKIIPEFLLNLCPKSRPDSNLIPIKP